MKKKLTILDIARMANVSKSTVSRYFNNGYVKDETRQIISQIVEKYDFIPNAFARLKAKRSNIIGVIAPCLDSIATSKALMGIDAYFYEKGISTFIMNTNHDIELELKYLKKLEQMNVDGVILSATYLTSRHLELIENLKIPVVVIGQPYEQGSVVHNDYQAGKEMAEYLLNLGYKDILIIGIDQKDQAIGVERTNGLLDYFKKNNISYRLEIADFSYEMSSIVLKRSLFEKKPEIVICLTTQQLLAAYSLFQDLGYIVSEEVALCGFGGYDYIKALKPKITTIQFDHYLSGKKAAEMMLNKLSGMKVKKELIDYQFCKGNSLKGV